MCFLYMFFDDWAFLIEEEKGLSEIYCTHINN